jgi:hypothetical protein
MTKRCPNCGSLSKHGWRSCDGTAKSFYLCGCTETEGAKSEGDNPQLITYSYVVKRAVKPVNNTKFVSFGTMDRYSALTVTETAPLSPKPSNEDLSTKGTVVPQGIGPGSLSLLQYRLKINSGA